MFQLSTRFGLRSFLIWSLILLFSTPGIAQFSRNNNRKSVPYRTNYQRGSSSSGSWHTFEIRDGELWGWGRNEHGQLGDGTTTLRTSPVRIGSESNWVSVVSTSNHSVGLRNDGTLWTWGYNGQGQLGNGTTTGSINPIQVGSDNNWVSIGGGVGHSIALKANGTLWSWGWNAGGQLGLGDNTDRTTPEQIGNDNNWIFLVAGVQHNLAIKSNGTLWSWGNNNENQLGDGTNTNRNVPTQVDNDNTWIAADGGEHGSIALKANGTLWAWGQNQFGQVGDGSTTARSTPVQVGTDNNWVFISAGQYQNHAIKSTGTLWAWGRNNSGQLGDGTTTDVNSPVQIGSATNWVGVFGGDEFCIGLTSTGRLWSWGANNFGQLGNGTTTNSSNPIEISSQLNHWLMVAGSIWNNHSVGLRSNGTLWTWGQNNSGQLGDNSTTDRNSAVQVGTDTTWISVAAGGQHSLGLKSNGTVWAWGLNNNGQIGDNSTTTRNAPVQVGTDNTWISISAGETFSLGLKSNGTIWYWGFGSSGNGNGGTSNSLVPVQVGSITNWANMDAGHQHVHAIKTDGTLWAWGNGGNGQLGTGNNSNQSSPIQIGTATTWNFVSGGTHFTMGLLANGTIQTWGRNISGQLGSGNTTWTTSPNQMGADNNWILANAGFDWSFGIKSTGTLWGWGNNGNGQLGNGTTTSPNSPVQVDGDNLWTTVAGANNHSIGLKIARNKYCAAGANSSGQLGNGTTTQSTSFSCSTQDPAVPNNLIGASQTLCGPQVPAPFTGTTPTGCSGFYTYQWSSSSDNSAWTNVTGATNIDLTLGTVSATTYYRRTVSSFGCSSTSSNSVSITVISIPSVSVTPSGSVGYCQSGSVILTASGATTYLWSNASTGNTISVSSPDTFSVSGTTNGCTGTSSVVTVTEISPVTNNVLGANQAICFGEVPASLTGTTPSGGIGSFTYQWQSSSNNSTWSDIGGATADSYSTGRFIFHSYYRRLVSSGGCVSNSSVVQITVNNCQPVISAGQGFSRVLCMDSTAWGWGGSFLGLLGHGSGNGSVTAVRSLNLTEVVQVSAGGSFTMYLKKDGTVWMTGDGRFGAMGNGTNTAENNTPVQVSNLTNVVAIAAGNNNPYALRSDGTVWGWAINNQGQMGDGIPSQPDRLTPIQIPNLTNAIKIAAGANHALAIREDSTVWGWGRNDFSQAGAGAGHRPAAVITGLSGIKEIGCGEHFSMALKGDGTVWVWGRNHQGQLGLGDNSDRGTPTQVTSLINISAISLRTYSMSPIVLSNNGRVFTWGLGSSGQIGNGTNTSSSLPVQVTGLSNVIQVSNGQAHQMALTALGQLYAWGSNSGGCLGDGTTTNRNTPVLATTLSCPLIEAISNNIVSSAQTLCIGTSAAQLSGSTPLGCSGFYTYQWQSSSNNSTWTNLNGETSSNFSPGSISASSYFRRVVTSSGCYPHPSTAVLITIEQLIGTNTIGSAQTICHSNTPASLTGSQPSGGSGMYNFTWLSSTDNSTFTAISGATLQNYMLGPLNSTQFLRREVSSGICPANTSSVVRIDVLSPISNNVVTGNQSLCAGINPAAFTSSTPTDGNGTFTYQWESSQDNSTWVSITGATLITTAPLAISQNTYFRRLVNSATCVSSTSASVYILRLEPIGDNSIMANQTLCAPTTPASISGSLPSGASGSYTYLWQSSSNLTSWSQAGGINMSYQPGIISATTYHRRIVSSAGCHSDTSSFRDVLVAPIINIISSSQTINYEDIPAGFTGVTNAQNPNYIWETSRNNFHWAGIQGAVNANYAESNPMTQWAWYRRKIAVAGCDTAISNSVIVQLNNLLHDSITITTNGPLCTPTPLYLNVNSTIPGLTYNWTGPNGFTATGFNPTISNSQEIQTGVYRCVARDTSLQDSFVATMHVWVSPLMSALNVAYNQPVCEGSTLNISAAGLPGVAYSWTGPNGFTSDQYQNRLTGANNNMNGVYSLVASSPGCGSTSRSLSVNINAIPNPMPGSNGPICTSSVLYLTSATPAGSTALWAGPNNFSSNLYQPSIASTQTIHSGTYTLTVTRPGCQSVIRTTTVQVNTPVSGISVSSNSPVCQSGTLQLSATASTAQYQWSGPNGFNSTTISPSLGNVTSLQNGVYTLQVVSPGCGSTSRTTNVQVITPGSISVGSNSPICAGTTLALTSTSVPGATVLWEGPNSYSSALANPSISGAQTMRSGVYTVTVTSAGCTPSVGTTTVTVSSSVNTLTAVSNTPVCEGSAINLSVPLVNGVTYAWTGPQSFTATGNTASVPNAAVANAGNYVLSMTSPGCASVSRTLSVLVRSSTTAIAGSNSPRCSGNVLYLTVNTIAGATYVWRGPNGFTSTQQSPALSNVQPVQSGNYSLTVSFAGCASSTQSIPVVVYPSAANVQVSAAQTLCSGSSLTLTGTSVSGATMSWVGPNAFTASGSSISVPVTTIANAGRYAYSVLMPGCPTVQRNSNVTIMDAAAVNGTITTPLCTSAAMYMNAAFIAGATYQWQAPDGFNSTQKAPSRIQVTVPMAGVYTLSVNVPGCGIVSQTIAVTINVCRDGEFESDTEEEVSSATDYVLLAYPNPFGDQLHFEISGIEVSAISLTDLQGRTLKYQSYPAADYILHGLDVLPSGAYFIHFETSEGRITRKLMKQ